MWANSTLVCIWIWSNLQVTGGITVDHLTTEQRKAEQNWFSACPNSNLSANSKATSNLWALWMQQPGRLALSRKNPVFFHCADLPAGLSDFHAS